MPFSLTGAPEVGHFVARQQELADIHQGLRSDGTRRVVVLHGLGGIGKTQLAIEYAKRYRENYSAVFWLSIKDDSSLKQSFRRVAGQIQRAHPSAAIPRIDENTETDEIIASCETTQKQVFSGGAGGYTEHKAQAIASVYTNPKYRKNGMAALLLNELKKWFDGESDSECSALYSDIGKVEGVSLLFRSY